LEHSVCYSAAVRKDCLNVRNVLKAAALAFSAFHTLATRLQNLFLTVESFKRLKTERVSITDLLMISVSGRHTVSELSLKLLTPL